MDKEIEVLINGKLLLIKCFPLDNSRKVMKFRIYLNAVEEIKYDFIDDELRIIFNLTDEVLINNRITKIVKYLEDSLFLKVKKSDTVSKKIEQNKKSHSEFIRNQQLVVNLKKGEFEKTTDYIEFCDSIDYLMKIKLRDYQYKASYFLCKNKGGFDFSVPGSGKTIISYASYTYMKSDSSVDSILIIGPLNSYNAWFDEYITCFGYNPDFYSLANLSKKDSVNYLLSSAKNHSEITFINIGKAWRFSKEILSFLKNKKTLLIIDEGHKEKNPNAAITKAVLEITKHVYARIILTGTPMPNGYEDLFSLMKIYSPYEKIISYTYKQLRDFTKNGAKSEDESKIMNSIFPYYSRVSKKYLLEKKELLEPKCNYITCDLSNEQAEIYNFLNTMVCEIDDEWESEFNLSLMKAISIRKMQVSANPGLLSKSIINSIDEYKKEYYEEFEKDDSMNEILLKADRDIKSRIMNSSIAHLIFKFENGCLRIPKNEKAIEIAISLVELGHKVIIWDIFVQNMNCVQKMFKSFKNVDARIINGSISSDERQVVIESFKYGSCNVLIANPATLAESISLHKVCQHAIYVNRNFNAAQFIQSKDRIHRINMPKGTTANYYYLINANTFDEVIDEKLKLKEERMLRILDSDEIMIGGNEFENNSFISKDDVIDSYKR